MEDQGTNPEGLIQVATLPSDAWHSSPSGCAADDIIPALTRRVAYLEGRLASTQADLDAARRRIAAYAKADLSLNEARADAYRIADEIRQRAQADEILKVAIDVRQMRTNEVRRLHGERETLQKEISSLGRRELFAGRKPIEPESPAAFDLETAVIEEMRSVLLEIVGEVRARPAAVSAPVESVVAKSEVAVVAVSEAPVVEQIVEHVEELVRPPSTGPIEDEYVEDLRG